MMYETLFISHMKHAFRNIDSQIGKFCEIKRISEKILLLPAFDKIWSSFAKKN